MSYIPHLNKSDQLHNSSLHNINLLHSSFHLRKFHCYCSCLYISLRKFHQYKYIQAGNKLRCNMRYYHNNQPLVYRFDYRYTFAFLPKLDNLTAYPFPTPLYIFILLYTSTSFLKSHKINPNAPVVLIQKILRISLYNQS